MIVESSLIIIITIYNLKMYEAESARLRPHEAPSQKEYPLATTPCVRTVSDCPGDPLCPVRQ